MRGLVCGAMALLLAGCGGAADPANPEAACRAQADATPEVRMLRRAQPPIRSATEFQTWEDRLQLARVAATQNCLADRGLGTRSGFGVEPVIRR